MLRLVGTKGDGWLPSLAWMESGALGAGNRLIDAAAREAGRDPRQIERLLNVPPDRSADLLVRAAIAGVSTFIVATDDPDELRRFAQRTVPEVRERVASARAGSTS